MPEGRPEPLRRAMGRSSGRESHASDEIRVARVRSNGVEERLDLQEHHHLRALGVAFLEPLEGAVAIAEPDVAERDVRGGAVVWFLSPVQWGQHLLRRLS